MILHDYIVTAYTAACTHEAHEQRRARQVAHAQRLARLADRAAVRARVSAERLL